MTNKNLEKLVQYWQPRLKLKDWDFTIRFTVDDAEMEEVLKSGYGKTNYSYMSKKASILIKPYDKIDANALSCKDIEVTVVHELLHMLFMPIDENKTDTPSRDAVEHIVETTALALVSEKRKKTVK